MSEELQSHFETFRASTDSKVRARTIYQAASYGALALPLLREALQDDEPAVRVASTYVLNAFLSQSEIDNNDIAQDLLIALHNETDMETAINIADAVGILGNEFDDVVLKALKHEREIVRWAAARAAMTLMRTSERYVSALMEAVEHDDSEWVKGRALGNLRYTRDSRVLPAFVSVLKSNVSDESKKGAISDLQLFFKDNGAEGALHEILSSESISSEVRKRVVEALNELSK